MINEVTRVVHREEMRRPSTGVARERRGHREVESRRRGLLKALSWRVIAVAATVGIVLTLTGEVRFAAIVGSADALVKLGLYYMHERAWNRIGFGWPTWG